MQQILYWICIFSPRPLKAKEMPAYLKCVQLILQFLQSVVLNLPAGTTPLIFADINTGFGDSQHKEPGDDLYVGMCHHERENEAAVHVRHFLRETGLCIVDTCFDSGPTFWPTRSSSGKRLDHIIAPRDMLERFSACRTYSRAGWRMQLANTSRKWDHWPLVAEFRLLDAQQRHRQQRMEPKTEWDKRLLRDFVLYGEQRQEYLDKLDGLSRSNNDQFVSFFDASASPDQMHALFIDTFKSATEDILCTTRADTAQAPTPRSEMAEAKKALLQQRRELRDHLQALMQPNIDEWSNNALP